MKRQFSMKIEPFKLERYFAKYEFSAKYLLSSSDCDGLLQQEVLSYADVETLSVVKETGIMLIVNCLRL